MVDMTSSQAIKHLSCTGQLTGVLRTYQLAFQCWQNRGAKIVKQVNLFL